MADSELRKQQQQGLHPEKLKLSEIKFADKKSSTGVDQVLTAPTEKSGGNISFEPEKLEMAKKLRIHGPEDELDQEYDEQIDEESEQTDRLLAENFKSPRGKLRKKQTLRATVKGKRSIFKETISTKVKKQEKFNTENENGWNRNQPQLTSRANGPSALKVQKNAHNGSNLSTIQHKDDKKLGPRQYMTKHSFTLYRKNKNKDDEESDHEDLKQAQLLQEYNRFRMEPPELNEDGTEKYVLHSRLMLKLQKVKLKDPEVYSEDELVNSFRDNFSECSETEEESDTSKKKIKRKAKKKKKAGAMVASQVAAARKLRKPIMNVYCTEYDIVKKAAKVFCGYRLRERKEDHDGAIVNGQTNQKLSEEYDVTWHDLFITPDFFSKMLPYQKVNQFPGIYQITKKNNLARNLMKMRRVFPEAYQFFPRTYILPGEASEFRNQFIDRQGRPVNRRKTFIVKPDNLAQGRGIYLSRNCEKIIENCTNEGGGWVVQDYLANPHIIEELKYDLRIYVMLYGLNPLRIFIHEQGLARFATEPYEKPRNGNMDNMFVHLTNYAINKMNSKFQQNNKQAKDDYDDEDYDDEDDDYGDEEEGHKRSMFAILKILLSQGADPDKIMAEIKDIIIKTIIGGQPYMNHMYRVCQPECLDNSMAFQILGFDIMIDKNFRPWLIEVNQSPSFATDSPLDYEVKKSVLKDCFNLLNVSQQRRETWLKNRNDQAAERMATGKTHKMSAEEREALREERLQERFIYERMKLNEGSGFELIYPPLGDEEKEEQYEGMLKKANDIWDEFTTGKNKKKMEEQKVEKKKSQPIIKTPVQDHKESDIEETDSEEVEENIIANVIALPVSEAITIQEKSPERLAEDMVQLQTQQTQQSERGKAIIKDRLHNSTEKKLDFPIISQLVAQEQGIKKSESTRITGPTVSFTSSSTRVKSPINHQKQPQAIKLDLEGLQSLQNLQGLRGLEHIQNLNNTFANYKATPDKKAQLSSKQSSKLQNDQAMHKLAQQMESTAYMMNMTSSLNNYTPLKAQTPQKSNQIMRRGPIDQTIPKSQNTFLNAIRGDLSSESKNFFTQAGNMQMTATKNTLNASFDRRQRPGFDTVATAAFARFGPQEGVIPFVYSGKEPMMNIQTTNPIQKSPLEQQMLGKMQSLRKNSPNTWNTNGHIYLQGQKKKQHYQQGSEGPRLPPKYNTDTSPMKVNKLQQQAQQPYFQHIVNFINENTPGTGNHYSYKMKLLQKSEGEEKHQQRNDTRRTSVVQKSGGPGFTPSSSFQAVGQQALFGRQMQRHSINEK